MVVDKRAGWYEDPDSDGGGRYWNGGDWTNDRIPALPEQGWYPNPESDDDRYWDGHDWTTITKPFGFSGTSESSAEDNASKTFGGSVLSRFQEKEDGRIGLARTMLILFVLVLFVGGLVMVTSLNHGQSQVAAKKKTATTILPKETPSQLCVVNLAGWTMQMSAESISGINDYALFVTFGSTSAQVQAVTHLMGGYTGELLRLGRGKALNDLIQSSKAACAQMSPSDVQLLADNPPG